MVKCDFLRAKLQFFYIKNKNQKNEKKILSEKKLKYSKMNKIIKNILKKKEIIFFFTKSRLTKFGKQYGKKKHTHMGEKKMTIIIFD